MLKIKILGGPGSGKTTLGAEIAAKFDLPFYEGDVLGRKNGTQHSAWIQNIFEIISVPGWVMECNALIWNDPILDHADYIVLLEVPWRTAAYRIVRRHIIKSLKGINPHPGIDGDAAAAWTCHDNLRTARAKRFIGRCKFLEPQTRRMGRVDRIMTGDDDQDTFCSSHEHILLFWGHAKTHRIQQDHRARCTPEHLATGIVGRRHL